MSPEERENLRAAAIAAMNALLVVEDSRSKALPWELQTSNSFRRIGTSRGDGDVLCGTKHPRDGYPDLLARPGVLEYVVAAQPSVVLELLGYVDMIEGRLARLDEIEEQLIKMRAAVDVAMREVFR